MPAPRKAAVAIAAAYGLLMVVFTVSALTLPAEFTGFDVAPGGVILQALVTTLLTSGPYLFGAVVLRRWPRVGTVVLLTFPAIGVREHLVSAAVAVQNGYGGWALVPAGHVAVLVTLGVLVWVGRPRGGWSVDIETPRWVVVPVLATALPLVAHTTGPRISDPTQTAFVGSLTSVLQPIDSPGAAVLWLASIGLVAAVLVTLLRARRAIAGVMLLAFGGLLLAQQLERLWDPVVGPEAHEVAQQLPVTGWLALVGGLVCVVLGLWWSSGAEHLVADDHDGSAPVP